MQRSSPDDARLGRAMALVRFLREKCDWDARQTPDSLLPYLLEEAHEVAEAVRRGDEDELHDELGDLLLNVAYQIVLAEQRGAFDAREVVARMERKMVARHPHVYGDAEVAPDWETLKAAERMRDAGPRSAPGDGDPAEHGRVSADPLAGIPAGLEPLSRALRVQERAAGVGFDWPDAAGAITKLREEIAELESVLCGRDRMASPSSAGRTADAEILEEAGDLLFAVINVCRLAGAHPLTALDGATAKFARRFRRVVERARERGVELETAGLAALDLIWDEVKASEPD